MKKLLRRWLARVPFARAVWHAVRPWSPGERAEARDQELTRHILDRVLTPDACCVDIGAHKGDVLAEFVRRAPRGRHFAFEPVPTLAAVIRTRFPGVPVEAVAVADRPGEVEFHWFPDMPAFSGIERRTDVPAEQRVELIRVRAVPLDDLLPPDVAVRLLKIDVEGAEGLVLRGAARVLAANRPWVLFEHGGASLPYGTSSADVYREFARHALAVWRPDHWLAGGPPLDEPTFATLAASGEWWNFLAGPAPDRP